MPLVSLWIFLTRIVLPNMKWFSLLDAFTCQEHKKSLTHRLSILGFIALQLDSHKTSVISFFGTFVQNTQMKTFSAISIHLSLVSSMVELPTIRLKNSFCLSLLWTQLQRLNWTAGVYGSLKWKRVKILPGSTNWH